MTATLLYRIAAIIFVFFAVGHTYGFLSLRPPSPEGRAVYDSMNAVHFEVRGRNYSYGAFYRGFGLILHGSNAPIGVSVVASRPVGAFHSSRSGMQLPGVVLSFLYFGPPPMMLSSVVALILGCAVWLAGR